MYLALSSERLELPIIAESATAPRLWMMGSVLLSPHSRLRHQCGVMQVVTARAVVRQVSYAIREPALEIPLLDPV